MKLNVRKLFDDFTFALGGVALKSPYVAIPVVADSRIRDAWDARIVAGQFDGADSREVAAPSDFACSTA